MSKIDQLCVITDEIGQDFEPVLDIALNYGVKTVDLRKVWGKNIARSSDKDLEDMKAALEKRKMKVAVITGPLCKCVFPNSRFASEKKDSFMRNPTYNLSLLDRIFEISDLFNTPYIRIFSFLTLGVKYKEKAWKDMIELLNPYIQEAEKRKKVLLVENDLGMMVGKIEHAKRFFNEIKSKNIKLLLDPGNFFMERDPTTPEAYEYFYENDLVGHIHVKDPIRKLPKLGALFTAVGEGKIDYPPLFKQAIDHGYKGYFSLETHSLRNKEENSKKSLQNMANWLKEL